MVDPSHNSLSKMLEDGKAVNGLAGISAVTRLAETMIPQRSVVASIAKASSWLAPLGKEQTLHDNSLISAVSDIIERKGITMPH